MNKRNNHKILNIFNFLKNLKQKNKLKNHNYIKAMNLIIIKK